MAAAGPESGRNGMREEWGIGLYEYENLLRVSPGDIRLKYASVIHGQLVTIDAASELYEAWDTHRQRDLGIATQTFEYSQPEDLTAFRDAGYGIRWVEISTHREIPIGAPLPRWIGEFTIAPAQAA